MMAAIGESNTLDVKRSIYGMRLNRRPDSEESSSSSDEEAEEEVVEAWEVDMALWAHVWITAAVLSEMLATPAFRAILPRCRVFEIGAGSGMPCAVAALHGAKHAVAADLYESGLRLARRTAQANGAAADRVHLRVFDWNEPCDEDLSASVDLLIGSDVMYVPHAGEPILARIKQLLAPGGVAVITDPGRVACEDFERRCRADPAVRVERHEVTFVRTASTTIPKLWVVVCTLAADADADADVDVASVATQVKKVVADCVAYYRAHRSNADAPASSVRETLF